MPNSISSRAGVPLLITVSSVSIPIVFIMGWVIGTKQIQGASLAADSISSWVNALATVAITVLTFILAKETWYLREAQVQQLAELKRENIRPNVSVQLEPSRVGMNFIDVKVANLGKGIARKVTITFLDQQGNTVGAGSDPVVEKFRKLSIFRRGIESMGIGQVISSFVFSFFDLGDELKGEIFKPILRMVVRFEDIEGQQYSTEYVVDFAQYEGISQLGGGDPTHQMAEELKKLREAFARLRLSDGKLAVNVFDADDRTAERHRHAQAIDQLRAQDNT